MLDKEKLTFGYNFKRICDEHDIAIADVAASIKSESMSVIFFIV